jgi:ABC-type antimicrobial peptide transport system permease subunit
MSKVALILGIIGIVIGGGVLLVSLILPMMSSHTSWDEAMLGIIPGALLLFLSFILAVVGLIFTLKKKKQLQP